MAKVLTQAEIDALLSVATDSRRERRPGDRTAPVVRYNFRRPDRVSKEQMHALQFLHERGARNLSTSLSAYLRTTINLSVSSVEQFSYQEFLTSLTDPTAFYSLSIAPFEELGAIEINPSVAFAMIDRMLGGSGQPVAISRPLTEIEQNVVDEVVKLMLDGLAEAWKAVTNLTFSIRGRETRPQMLQVAAPNEVVLCGRVRSQGGGRARAHQRVHSDERGRDRGHTVLEHLAASAPRAHGDRARRGSKTT